MLRPDMIVSYAKKRHAIARSDFTQLMDGINIGGRIIIGGNAEGAARLRSIMTANRKLGMVLAVPEMKDPELDQFITYSFDVMAISQMVMIAKNEAFHATVDQCINLIQDLCVEKGKSIEVGLQVLREKADEIGHL